MRRTIEDREEIVVKDDASASLSNDGNSNSVDSFGVAGDWGNVSEDSDSGDEGLVLESTFPVIRG